MASASNVIEQINLLVQSVYDNQVCSFISIACLMATTYDTTIHFDDEHRLIWASKWTPGKLLYIGCRYFTQFYLLSSILVHTLTDCSKTTIKGWYHTLILLAELGAICPELLLVLRTQVIYGRRKAIKWVTFLLFFAEQCFKWTLIILLIIQSKVSLLPFGGLPCIFSIVIGHDHISRMLYAAAFAFEFILWVLSVSRLLPLVISGQRSVVLILFRDGVLYYTTVTLLCFSQVIVSIFVVDDRPALADAMDPIMICMSNILSSHFILSLRKHVKKDEDDKTATQYPTMQFAEGRETSMTGSAFITSTV